MTLVPVFSTENSAPMCYCCDPCKVNIFNAVVGHTKTQDLTNFGARVGMWINIKTMALHCRAGCLWVVA